MHEREILVTTDHVQLEGNLSLPNPALGMILFAHGSGSSRHSPRNRFVARTLSNVGLGTLLIDLLTQDEEMIDQRTRHLRFDINLLARRLVGAIEWLCSYPNTQSLNLGLFGSSTGAGAALVAAAARPDVVKAVVSRGGRPDLAGTALSYVQAPTLLIVGSQDVPVLGLNQQALEKLHTVKRLELIPGAAHLFEESGTLELVAQLAQKWFTHHLTPASAAT